MWKYIFTIFIVIVQANTSAYAETLQDILARCTENPGFLGTFNNGMAPEACPEEFPCAPSDATTRHDCYYPCPTTIINFGTGTANPITNGRIPFNSGDIRQCYLVSDITCTTNNTYPCQDYHPITAAENPNDYNTCQANLNNTIADSTNYPLTSCCVSNLKTNGVSCPDDYTNATSCYQLWENGAYSTYIMSCNTGYHGTTDSGQSNTICPSSDSADLYKYTACELDAAQTCQAGYCVQSDPTLCEIAPANTYSPDGEIDCIPCPNGTTTNSTGATAITACGITRGDSTSQTATKFCDDVGCFTIPGNAFINGTGFTN